MVGGYQVPTPIERPGQRATHQVIVGCDTSQCPGDGHRSPTLQWSKARRGQPDISAGLGRPRGQTSAPRTRRAPSTGLVILPGVELGASAPPS